MSPFLDFGLTNGLEINKELTPYTKIEKNCHITLFYQSGRFRNLQLAIEALDLCQDIWMTNIVRNQNTFLNRPFEFLHVVFVLFLMERLLQTALSAMKVN